MDINAFLNRPVQEIAVLVGIAVGSVCLLLIVIAFVLDKLNVKSFSFTKGFTFYQEGETRKRRITRRRKSAK